MSKIYFILAGLLISAAVVYTDPIRSREESDAYPKGYYNGDLLPEKTAYLTFDDGPSEWTEGILDILKQEGVRATFFISAYWNNKKLSGRNSFQKYPEALRRIVKEGHVLGNHTYGHTVLSKLPAEDIRIQFTKNQNYLNQVLGKNAPVMTIIRLPLGRPWSNRTSLETKKHVGKTIRKIGIVAMWTGSCDTTDSWDWASGEWYKSSSKVDENNPSFIRKKERIYNRVANNADGEGMVILMHDTHLTTREVLLSIITELKRRGYRFCTMEEFVLWKYGKGSGELVMR